MSYLGFPLVGDPLYGRKKEEFKVNGQMLHAAKIKFTHPRTQQVLEFSAALPIDMAGLIKKLRTK
jgi:23S rRNA pseudouridine1911/1915/1917 synthase